MDVHLLGEECHNPSLLNFSSAEAKKGRLIGVIEQTIGVRN